MEKLSWGDDLRYFVAILPITVVCNSKRCVIWQKIVIGFVDGGSLCCCLLWLL